MVTRGIVRAGRWTAAMGLATACAASAPNDAKPAARSVDQGWRDGPRDSALASAVACELLGMLDPERRGCIVEGYRETAAEYVLRVRRPDPDDGTMGNGIWARVRLPRHGDSATVERLATP